MYSIEEIQDVRAEAKFYGLAAPNEFWQASDEEVQKVYNGCGPDRWPGWTRCLASKITHRFRAAVMIHDWRYQFSDKTRPGFDLANSEFLTNMRIIIEWVYSWWTDAKSKAIAYAAAQAMYYVVQWGGWSAWCDATPKAEKGAAA